MAKEHIVVKARQRAQEFCDRFGLRVPIVQAPMAGSSPPALAIAVAKGTSFRTAPHRRNGGVVEAGADVIVRDRLRHAR